MDSYLLYFACVCIFFILLHLAHADLKKHKQAQPHDEPAEETPELDPEIYSMALAYLLVEAELRGLELVQRRGDDEAGKGAKV